jgi:sugar/nucleoside kinase (ribokinase family)
VSRPNRPGDGVLTVIGDLVEDVVVWTAAPIRHGTDNAATVHRSRGGSAANVAALAASVVATRFVGRVGADGVGSSLVAALTADGVDARVQRGGRTGAVVVLVDETGERTMFPDRGASVGLERVPPDWLVGTAVLHVPAYGFGAEPAASSILGAVHEVRRSGAALSVDVSATTLVEHVGVDAFRTLLDELRPELLFANREEAEILGLDASTPSPGCVFVVKDGPRPAVVVDAGGHHERVPAPAVPRVMDTTGAGDAFAAGFLGAWMQGAALDAACRAGHGFAARVLAAPGAG